MSRVILLVLSALLFFVAWNDLGSARLKANHILDGLTVAAIPVCLLPWIVLIRQKLFVGHPPLGKRGSKVVTALLGLSGFFGPVVLLYGVAYLNFGNRSFGTDTFTLLASVIAHQIGMGLYVVAFLIQLWFDSWQKTLNCLSLAYQVVAFLGFVIALG